MFNKEAIFVTVGVWLYENQLVFLGGYPTHWGVANMIKGDDALTKILRFEAKWDENWYKHFRQPGDTNTQLESNVSP